MNRYKKVIGAILGGVTGGFIIWLGHLVGLSIDEPTAAGIAAGFAAVGTLFAPAQGAGW